jgi:ankyrin repeat protein
MLVQVMLKAGADVDAADSGGLTAAMHAAKMGNSAVIVMLVQEGNAALGLQCKQGKTALAYAADQPTVDTLAPDSIFLQAHGREFV